MNDRDPNVTPQQEAALDRHLLSLQRFAPKEGFDDRVMARVRRPAAALVRIRQRAKSVATPGRLWWASGLAAASSVGWTVALVNWLSGISPEALGAWLGAEIGMPLQNTMTQMAVFGAEALRVYALQSYETFGNALFGMVAALSFLPVLSSWGLYLTLKQTRGKRSAPYAAR